MERSAVNTFDNANESHRRNVVLFLLFMNVVTSAAVSIYIPCLRHMAVDLGTTNAMMQMTIVIHLIGEFVGRFFCGPLMDFYEEKRIVLPALLLSAIGHGGCFMADSIGMFMLMRFLQAFGASVVYIASVGVINMEYGRDAKKNSVIGILELYQPIAWILSPFVGCILGEISSWRLSFLVLMLSQIFGVAFFRAYHEREVKPRPKLSVSKFICDYGSILKNSYFVTYALIPGLFTGGYMIFASNSPFICSRILGNNSADIALFQAIPLMFYVLATFAYRVIVNNFGVRAAKRIGIVVYIIFGIYMFFMVLSHRQWVAGHLLALMCVQCIGSAFLVPISVLKALQSSEHASSAGASTVVVFRNIIMSLCISLGAKMSESITMIMGAVFMTVGTVLVLMITRKIMKKRYVRKKLSSM